jgi:hypothetical protein
VRHKVSFEPVADLPLLELDAVLFEQMLSNLLDSAAKYAAGMDSAFPWSKIMPLRGPKCKKSPAARAFRYAIRIAGSDH